MLFSVVVVADGGGESALRPVCRALGGRPFETTTTGRGARRNAVDSPAIPAPIEV